LIGELERGERAEPDPPTESVSPGGEGEGEQLPSEVVNGKPEEVVEVARVSGQ
jgi:hypothetical protein